MSQESPIPRFKLGDKVRFRADPAQFGVVAGGPRRQQSGFEYEVFSDGSEEWNSEGFLEPAPARNFPRWETWDGFQRDLVLAKRRNPLTDALYAYRASRTMYQPYQFRPALKFLRNGGRGLLIADEVGLGKTIEAAIIYLELKARMDISRVMVLCPSRLTGKWQDELRNRFEEDFEVLKDGSRVQRLLDSVRQFGTSTTFHAIASFELMRDAKFVEQLVEHDVPLDLLIVDEAHYMRNEGSRTYSLGEALVNTADAVVLLTATPLHLRNRDLFNLLNLLAPDDFPSADLFEAQIRPNEYINRASRLVAARDLVGACTELQRVETTVLRDRFLRNPYYLDITRRLRSTDGVLSLPERIEIQQEIADLNTLASVFTRTRKREVTDAAVRAPYTVRVELTPPERAFYDAVLDHTRSELRAAGPGALGFAAVMKERQAASCLAAFRERLEDAHRRQGDLQIDVERSAFDLHGQEANERATSTDDLVRLSRELGSVDTKFHQFEYSLRRALDERPHSKALVFSFFRGTLEYLLRQLRARGHRVQMIHGGVPVAERRRIIETFGSTDEFRVLLSSEVGAEGLDFQFCDVLVNYDLPWNPMQVEQRIGRIDRFGQKSERIRIYNFFIDDTIETRIFHRLYDRIGLFERSIGDLEAILGDEILELSRQALQARLTPEEETRLAIAASERIVRRQRDEDELERHKDTLLGQGAILDQQIGTMIENGRGISGEEVRALVVTFLREQFPRSRMYHDEEEPCATLDIDPSLATHLSRSIERNKLQNRMSPRLRHALAEHRRLPFTFNDDYARQRPNLEFITMQHPLAEAAVDYWESKQVAGIPATGVEISGPEPEHGVGCFFVYLVKIQAAVPRTILKTMVVLDDGRFAEASAEALLQKLQGSARIARDLERDSARFSVAESIASSQIAEYRDKIQAETLRRNNALLAARAASIKASFEAKTRNTEALLSEATDERIRRMRTAQAHNLRAKMEAKLDDLRKGEEVVVSSALVVGGRLRISLEG